VPVTDPAMVAPAIAAALGLGERQARSAEDTIGGWLAPREALLVLDNCEHLLDAMPVLLERLLAGSPRLSVLVTSRARLLVPFEWVFPVPGLSIAADDGGPGDAVELFLTRAAAAGSALTEADTARIAAICRGLDGVALAIELTAARVPSLGLDGIEGRAGRPDEPAGRRSAGGRQAPFAPVRARLELRPARRGRPGGAAPDLGVRGPVHRDRGAGHAGRLAAGRPTARSGPRWPGSRTRACWSPSRTRPEPATARWRPSASTVPPSWTGRASLTRLRPAISAGAWRPPPRSGRRTEPGTPGGRRSISWPTSCAPRCAGRRPAPGDGPRRTGWRSRWPS
jgi:Predicted ATPase